MQRVATTKLCLKLGNSFIPALLGRPVSSYERDILKLSVRNGGMGITNLARTSQREYVCSKEITKPAVELILSQDQDAKKLLSVNLVDNQLFLRKKRKNTSRLDLIYSSIKLRLTSVLKTILNKQKKEEPQVA